jgi:hypothetical protein
MKGSSKAKAVSRDPRGELQASPWALTAAEKQAAAAALALSLIARIQTLLPGYSVDDYPHLLAPQHLSFEYSLSQGRPLVAPLLAGLQALGLHPAEVMTLSTLSLVLALIFAGLVACRLMGISNRPLESTAVLSLLALHPYQAEIFTFRTASILTAIPMSLAFAALAVPKRRFWHWAAAVAGMAAAVSIYQTVIHYVALALVLALWMRALEGEWKQGWERIRSSVILLVLGVAVYFAALKAMLLATGVTLNARGALIGGGDLLYRAAQIQELLERMFVRGEPLVPVATKVMLLVLLVFVWTSVMRAGHAADGAAGVRRRLVWLAGGTAAGVALSVGVIAVLKDWWPAPRVLSQIGLFWGGVLAIGLMHAGARMRPLLLGLGAAVVLSCTGLSIRVASEQLRLNRRDMTQAAQILAEVDRLPDAERLTGVCLHGGSRFYPAGFKTAFYDLNISALSVTWARTWLLNEVSGRNYVPPNDAVAAQAASYCANAPRWPRRDSVTRIGNYAVVCLPEP